MPVTPPERVSSDDPAELLLVRVVPPLLTTRPPLTVSVEVVLFSMTPVTFDPTPKLISTAAVPAPELVMVPTLLTAAVEMVMPLAAVLSFFRIRFPVPVTPPERVKTFVPVLSFVSVVPAALTARAPLTVSDEVELFLVSAVTFDPMPPLNVVVPLVAPLLVIVPLLLTNALNVADLMRPCPRR